MQRGGDAPDGKILEPTLALQGTALPQTDTEGGDAPDGKTKKNSSGHSATTDRYRGGDAPDGKSKKKSRSRVGGWSREIL